MLNFTAVIGQNGHFRPLGPLIFSARNFRTHVIDFVSFSAALRTDRHPPRSQPPPPRSLETPEELRTVSLQRRSSLPKDYAKEYDDFFNTRNRNVRRTHLFKKYLLRVYLSVNPKVPVCSSSRTKHIISHPFAWLGGISQQQRHFDVRNSSTMVTRRT